MSTEAIPISACASTPRAAGLTVDFTDGMDSKSATPNTFVVEVDVAEAASAPSNGTVAGHRPFIVPGTVTVEADGSGQASRRFRFKPSHAAATASGDAWIKIESARLSQPTTGSMPGAAHWRLDHQQRGHTPARRNSAGASVRPKQQPSVGQPGRGR